VLCQYFFTFSFFKISKEKVVAGNDGGGGAGQLSSSDYIHAGLTTRSGLQYNLLILQGYANSGLLAGSTAPETVKSPADWTRMPRECGTIPAPVDNDGGL